MFRWADLEGVPDLLDKVEVVQPRGKVPTCKALVCAKQRPCTDVANGLSRQHAIHIDCAVFRQELEQLLAGHKPLQWHQWYQEKWSQQNTKTEA